MGNNKLISIKLTIAGKSYPIKVEENEEAIARKIEKELNQKINDFQIEYKDIDQVDSLVMVLITYAFDINKLKTTKETQVAQKLEIIEQLVESKLQ